jgi:diguanylate cyclase (GGDEF)-like protein/PAS domain S-box-containing protein
MQSPSQAISALRPRSPEGERQSPDREQQPPAGDLAASNTQRAADVLLREHRDAAIYAATTDGVIVPIPPSLGLEGHRVLASEGRSGLDLWMAEDRVAVVNSWLQMLREGVAQARARLRSDPGQWRIMRMLDLRARHDVVLHIVWTASEGSALQDVPVVPVAEARPRFCTRKQDGEANVLDCDDAYVQMFGYGKEEVIGKPTFERMHPDDQARVIEGWIATVATGRVQMFRVRMKCRDGSWLWVDTTLHNFLSDEEQPHVLAECIDVSAEMAAQEALQDREELLRNLIEEMPDGLLQLDREREIVYHNTRLLEVWPASADLAALPARPADGGEADGPAAADGVTLPQLLHALTEESRRTFDAVLERSLSSGVRADVEVEAKLPFDQRRNILMKVRPLQRDSGLITGAIASVQDITDSVRARRELEQRATFDALTGVHNRSSIMAALVEELERSSDTGVVYVDLDRFKSVNDTLGHAAGDEVLVEVATRLKLAMRSSDELGRLGGDEFLILLRGVCGLDVAMSAAQRISDALRGTCVLSSGSVELCASVGVACVDDTPVSAEALVERADAAMYRSKEQRRGIPVLAA